MLSAIDSFEPGVIWTLIWYLLAIVWSLRLLFSCVRSAVHNCFGFAAQYLTIWVVGFAASFIMFNFSGHYIHLAAMYPSYYQKIKLSPESKQVFSWGGLGYVGTAQMHRTLVYSPALPPQFDDANYRAEVGGELPEVRVSFLIGSFYLQEIWW